MADPTPDLLAALQRSVTAAKVNPTPILTDAEREGGHHVIQRGYTGLVFTEDAVARIKADAVAAARADERRLTLLDAARAYDETEAGPGDHAAAWLRRRVETVLVGWQGIPSPSERHGIPVVLHRDRAIDDVRAALAQAADTEGA